MAKSLKMKLNEVKNNNKIYLNISLCDATKKVYLSKLTCLIQSKNQEKGKHLNLKF